MKIHALKTYLLSKPEAIEDFPFGIETAVFKVAGKMFALVFKPTNNNDYIRINLKCDPSEAIELRTVFTCVLPAYHMNKKHWNTVIVDGSLPNTELQRMIDNSYALVVQGLAKNVRTGLQLRHGSHKI